MVPYLRAANVKDGHLDLSDVKEMNFSRVEQPIFALRPGDVLVTEGAGSLAAVGASATWNGEVESTVCFQNTLLRLRPIGTTNARFLAWWSRHAYCSGLYASIAGGANIYHLGAEHVRSLPVWIPPSGAQRRIADFLDREAARIDSLVAAKRRLLTLVESRQMAHIEACCGVSASQQTVPLRRLITRIVQGWSPDCLSRSAEELEWGVVRAGSVKPLAFDPYDNKALPDDREPRPELMIRQNDLLVNRASGSIDLVASAAVAEQVRPNLMLCDKVFRLDVRPGVSRRFLMYALASPSSRQYLEARLTGNPGTAYNLAQDVLLASPIPDFTTPDQEALAKCLDASCQVYRAARRRIERQLGLLNERRQALITAAVTGEIEIPGAAA